MDVERELEELVAQQQQDAAATQVRKQVFGNARAREPRRWFEVWRVEGLLGYRARSQRAARTLCACGAVARGTQCRRCYRQRGHGAEEGCTCASCTGRYQGGIRHGTEACYIKLGCRRLECVEAARERRAMRKQRGGRAAPRVGPLASPDATWSG